jgi:urease accessory protein
MISAMGTAPSIAVAAAADPPSLLPGHAWLEVGLVSGQSSIISCGATSPLKLLTPRPRGPSVWTCLSSFGGGLVAGDETSLEIRLRENTHCLVGTQASTKVYRNPGQCPCGHQLKAALEVGSLLVLAPDPVQPFAGSAYSQRQAFYLQPGSGLVLVDWFSSGRAACGERWAFTRFHSRNDVFVDDKRLLVDSVLLDPSHGPLVDPHRMGRFNCLALALFLGEPVRTIAARALQEITARPVTHRAPLICSSSPVGNGALLRLAGDSVESVGREIHRFLAPLAEMLGDDPWARKW